MINFDRGTVWWIELPMNMHSHVQGGARPCVIVSNPLDKSGVVTVCPLSTKIDDIKTHPRVNVKKEGQVLVEQITTVDISSIGNYVGTLSDSDMNAVNEIIVEHLTSHDATQFISDELITRRKLSHIERTLYKIVRMLEFILWKDGQTYEKDLRNI